MQHGNLHFNNKLSMQNSRISFQVSFHSILFHPVWDATCAHTRDIRGAIYILWKQFGLGREKWFQLSHKTNVGAEKENSRRSSPSLPFPCEACFGGLAEGQPHLKLMQRIPFSSPSSSLGMLGLFRYLQGRCEAPRPINAHFLKPQ